VSSNNDSLCRPCHIWSGDTADVSPLKQGRIYRNDSFPCHTHAQMTLIVLGSPPILSIKEWRIVLEKIYALPARTRLLQRQWPGAASHFLMQWKRIRQLCDGPLSGVEAQSGILYQECRGTFGMLPWRGSIFSHRLAHTTKHPKFISYFERQYGAALALSQLIRAPSFRRGRPPPLPITATVSLSSPFFSMGQYMALCGPTRTCLAYAFVAQHHDNYSFTLFLHRQCCMGRPMLECPTVARWTHSRYCWTFNRSLDQQEAAGTRKNETSEAIVVGFHWHFYIWHNRKRRQRNTNVRYKESRYSHGIIHIAFPPPLLNTHDIRGFLSCNKLLNDESQEDLGEEENQARRQNHIHMLDKRNVFRALPTTILVEVPQRPTFFRTGTIAPLWTHCLVLRYLVRNRGGSTGLRRTRNDAPLNPRYDFVRQDGKALLDPPV
jgi:hypothetical protein